MAKERRGDESTATRQRLLDAGLAALRDESLDRLFEKLQARPISARAGLTTGAFYHHFDGQDSFIESLLYLAFKREPNPEVSIASTEFESAAMRGASFAEALLACTEKVITFQLTDTTFSLLLAVASKAPGDRELAARLREMYRYVEDQTAAFYDELLRLSGRELRPPFTLADFAGSIIALYEGLGLRQQVDPEAVPTQRFGFLILAIVDLMTRPQDDPSDAAGWIEANAPRWAPADGDPPATPPST